MICITSFSWFINFRDGGLCFHECSPRSILINITEGYISTKGGKGVSSKSAASCLWLISALHSTNHEVVYGPSPPPVGTRGNITLTFKDIQINCLTDHVDVYDGLPPYLLEGLSPVKSFQKIGSFCGFNATNLKHVTAKLGNMVVVIKANLSSGALSKGFSAKFSVNKCPGHCEGNQRCAATLHGEQCVCLEGWTGPRCDQSICPNNCSFSKGQGQCKLVSNKTLSSLISKNIPIVEWKKMKRKYCIFQRRTSMCKSISWKQAAILDDLVSSLQS